MEDESLEKIAVLDHGYVALVEAWGSDEGIIRAARMSTGKGFIGWGPTCSECGYGGDMGDHEGGCSRVGETYDKPGDEKLLKYLWDHAHSTPFEFCGMTIEVTTPPPSLPAVEGASRVFKRPSSLAEGSAPACWTFWQTRGLRVAT